MPRGRTTTALQLIEAMSETIAYEQVNPVALVPAIAPHIAAEQVGRQLQATRLAGFCRGVMMGPADLVLVEGAGGWRVPLNPRETFADIARELNLGVILVVAMRPRVHQSCAVDGRGHRPRRAAPGRLGGQYTW